jgi:hypothetical protein
MLMPQWLKGQTSAIWVLNRWQSHPKIISDSSLDFSEVGERIALVRGDALQVFHFYGEQLTCRQTPLACFDWPVMGWSQTHGFSDEQAVWVQQVLPGLPWLEVVRAGSEVTQAPWTERHAVKYPPHDQAPWAWLGPRNTGPVTLEGFSFASAHHYAANHALQLRAADPMHADYASRLALAAHHCLQRSDEWACRVRHARTVVKRLAALAPEPEALYWQALVQAN